MISTCEFLGIYAETIERVAKECEDTMEKLGFSIREIDDMNDYAKEEFEDIGRLNEITDSIIGAYYRATEYMIHQKFPKLEVTYYVDGYCSSLEVGDLPEPMTEEEICEDWEKALETMTYSDISRTIRWGFSLEDLRELMRLHREDIQREKIEDLLEDCNFHTFCGCLSEDDYDGAEAEIKRIEEE